VVKKWIKREGTKEEGRRRGEGEGNEKCEGKTVERM
jgi:hypothetical protein